MPELPEVETVRRTLLPHLLGRRFVKVSLHQAQLRTEISVLRLRQALLGGEVVGIRRRAKYLLVDVHPGQLALPKQILMIHLGMTGRLGLASPERPLAKHDHVALGLSDGLELRYNDARRFGIVDVLLAEEEAQDRRLVHLGHEPLENLGAVASSLFAQSRSALRPIKTFLMDARTVVGVGNIYASEALFAAKIHPKRAAGKLSAKSWDRLMAAVVETLTAAIEEGGTTLRDFTNVEGDAGLFAVRLKVYGRGGQPCHECRHPIRRTVMAGRATYHCPTCQSR